jgi:hypothetical protein
MTEDESDMCWKLLFSLAVLNGQLHPSDHPWAPVLSNKDIQERLTEAKDKFLARWKELDPKGWEE